MKELPLEEKIEQIFESSWVNEFNYLENLMQRTRTCLCDLQQELQRKDNIINNVKDIMNRMMYMGYCAKTRTGTTATNFMATGENSEFGTRAKYILDKIKELENDN